MVKQRAADLPTRASVGPERSRASVPFPSSGIPWALFLSTFGGGAALLIASVLEERALVLAFALALFALGLVVLVGGAVATWVLARRPAPRGSALPGAPSRKAVRKEVSPRTAALSDPSARVFAMPIPRATAPRALAFRVTASTVPPANADGTARAVALPATTRSSRDPWSALDLWPDSTSGRTVAVGPERILEEISAIERDLHRPIRGPDSSGPDPTARESDRSLTHSAAAHGQPL